MKINPKIKILILCLIIIGIFAVIYVLNLKTAKKELTLFGNIEIRQLDLSFQVQGKIKDMFKEEGDYVQKGELIAVIDDRDYRANYNKASANVEVALALKNDAKSKYERQIELCKNNITSKQECTTLLNTKDKTAADYNAMVAQKEYAKNQLDYTKLFAPDEGIIMIRIQEPGATVQTGQGIYTMAKTKPVWVRAYINEVDLGNVKYGQKVKVLTDTIDPKTGRNREYEGQVGYISPVAEFTPKTVQSTDIRTSLVYRIRVYIYDIDEYLRQGMPVTIKIDLDGKK